MPETIAEQADQFAQDVHELLVGALPGDQPEIVALAQQDRYIIHGGHETKPATIPLHVSGRRHAELLVQINCCTDSSRQYLAVAWSTFTLKSTVDRTPLLRYEYIRGSRAVPSAHWHFHGERGTFASLLTQARLKQPGDLSKLHVPVGGHRFRPSLEDFLQFLITQCGIDARENWKAAVEAGRERWRRLQIKSVVRDAPEDAAAVLSQLGYQITSPPDGHPDTSRDNLLRW